MKRVVLPLAVVLILAIAGIYLQRRVSPHARQVAAWLPGGTILFEDMPDLHRTADRWPATALAQIIDEPEMQAFLERPMGRLPGRAEIDRRLAQARQIDPTHFFLAVTDWSGSGPPKAIAALCYAGSRQEVDSLVGELRKTAQEAWPEAKSDIVQYGSGEIETFTTPGFSAALAYRGQWLFISTDVNLLKATLDRFEGKHDPDNLAELPAFKSVMQHLPGGPDNFLFIRPDLMADKAASLELMLDPTADARDMPAMKEIQAVGAVMKLDGEVIRDAEYLIKQVPAETKPLAMDVMKLSTPDTIIALGGRVGVGGVQLPDPKSDPTGLIQNFDQLSAELCGSGAWIETTGRGFRPGSRVPARLANRIDDPYAPGNVGCEGSSQGAPVPGHHGHRPAAHQRGRLHPHG